MQEVQQRISRVAGANVPILITGESGTGKEVIARMVHQLSPWNSGPFVKVNCPAIPGTLVESELFGYERGAFTGAYGTKAGRVEQARRGTLFLDEIGEMNLELQAKLLQLLQDGQFCRIGANEEKRLEARVVFATNRSLAQEVADGNFRQDLYYRINVVNIELPALRERRSDIADLTRYFLDIYARQFNRSVRELPAAVMERMQSYGWPGNIRELENVMKRYVILGTAEAVLTEITKEVRGDYGSDLVPVLPDSGPINLKEITREATRKIERQVMLSVLERYRWNRKKAAKVLKISYRAMLYKLKEHGLRSPYHDDDFDA
jgi:two-component system response regulator AtoC